MTFQGSDEQPSQFCLKTNSALPTMMDPPRSRQEDKIPPSDVGQVPPPRCRTLHHRTVMQESSGSHCQERPYWGWLLVFERAARITGNHNRNHHHVHGSALLAIWFKQCLILVCSAHSHRPFVMVTLCSGTVYSSHPSLGVLTEHTPPQHKQQCMDVSSGNGARVLSTVKTHSGNRRRLLREAVKAMEEVAFESHEMLAKVLELD